MKILNISLLPLAGFAAAACGLSLVVPASLCMDLYTLLTLAFVIGFLPLFIAGVGFNTLAELRAGRVVADTPAPAATPSAELLQVGQVFEFNKSGCRARVKNIKVWAVLESNNELLYDYL